MRVLAWIAVAIAIGSAVGFLFGWVRARLGLTATYWVDPRCVRCGCWVQPSHRSRIDFDGCEWVCIQCVTER